MYTYAGDANLDGAITGDDYSAIDFNVAARRRRMVQRRLQLRRRDHGDDYAAIDFNILGARRAARRQPRDVERSVGRRGARARRLPLRGGARGAGIPRVAAAPANARRERRG
jgi:hypothetical protein